MANLFETDTGSELLGSYEAELKLVQADLTQKLDQIPELSGEPRKAMVRLAERALEEATELVRQTVIIPIQTHLHTDALPPSSTKCASKSKTYPPQRNQK